MKKPSDLHRAGLFGPDARITAELVLFVARAVDDAREAAIKGAA